MRPYIAVIYDSFHSALSSRVLWVAFIAIWILLGALAPIGYREDFTTTIRSMDFDNGTQLKYMLAKGLTNSSEKETALGRIAASMPEDIQRLLRRVANKDEVRIRTSRLADALNDALDDESWYDADAWRATARLKELRELDEIANDDITESLRRRRARLRIEAALPGVFEARSSRSILLTYAGADFPAQFAVGKTQFTMIANQFALPILMNWLLGFVLIFLGILVTASIVPDMLQPGSLHLLLSKPVSRSLLLISKFIGGCSFVFLCVCQLVGGLWLIAGLRLDIWNVRLLWCIPVAVFLFSVFYSVSLLAGLRWRSPILAIGITCMFGAFVLVIGVIGGYFDNLVRNPDRIRNVSIIGDDLIAVRRGGAVIQFDSQANVWRELMESDPMRADLVLPITKIDNDHAVTARIRNGRLNPYGSGAPDVLLLARANQWEPEPGLALPIATRRLLSAGDSIIAMHTGGLSITDSSRVIYSAAVDDPGSKREGQTPRDAAKDKPEAKPTGWFSQFLPGGGRESEFQPILPPGVTIVQPARVVVADDAQWLIVYSLGRVFRLQKPDPEQEDVAWAVTAKQELAGEAAQGAVVALSGSLLLIARAEESPKILNAQTLETIAEVELSKGVTVYSAVGLQDGKRFAMVTNDGECQIVAVEGKSVTSQPISINEVESVVCDNHTRTLLVAHHIDQIDIFDAESMKIKTQIRPSISSWRFVDHYVIRPLRMLTPQTGELGDTVSALVGGKTSITIGQTGPDEGEVLRFKILRPVLSCAGFVAVMLSISCLYFSRSDF